MDVIAHTLSHAIARPFYRRYAGVFLFLFFLLFGIQPSFADALRFHYAVIQGILQSPAFFLLAFAAAAVYTLTTILFIKQCLQKVAFDFLFLLNAIPPSARLAHLFRLNSLLLAPAGLYGLLVVIIAVLTHRTAMGLLFLAAILVLHVLAAAAALVLLRGAKMNQAVVARRFIPVSLRPSLVLFLLKFIFQKQFAVLLVTKLVSFAGLYFFVQLDHAVFENRMLWLIFITVLAGHSLIVYRNFAFVENELFFYRNMPVPLMRIAAACLVVYTILLLPEGWALRGLWINQQEPGDYVWMVLTGPLFLLLNHALLYAEGMDTGERLKLLFGVWLVFILFSLSRSHWLMPATGFVFSGILFRLSYRQYLQEPAHTGAG
ncbi:MAG: hypothetical protein ABW019_13820 [Chitinophagaceae bacterium]